MKGKQILSASIFLIAIILLSCSSLVLAENDTSTNNTQACIAEGQKGSLILEIPDKCCEGLKQIGNSFGDGTQCATPTDGTFICSICGDGKCGLGENKCNCPNDCSSTIKCSKNEDCGSGTSSTAFCSGNSVCSSQTQPVCLNPGTNNSQCSSTTTTGCASPCPNGCKDGACIKNVRCNQDSDCPSLCPTCGIGVSCGGCINYKCINGDCTESKEIKEQVKCIFDGSNQEQKCYTAEQNSRAYCSGKENCIADISGYKGEQITWKSTCGGYAYTVIDGNNEYAKFDCKDIRTCQPTKCDDGTTYECKIDNGQCICPTCPQIIVKPVCGNGICESGEGEICVTAQANANQVYICEEGKECKVPPTSCKVVCPQDCKQTEGIYANLNEKFKLQVYQPVKILENEKHLMKITFKDLIAYKCKETEISQTATNVINANIEKAEQIKVSTSAITGNPIKNVKAQITNETKPTILKCIGAGPKALLGIDMIADNELGKHMVLNLELNEKKQVDEFIISFLNYDYASRTGTFLVSRGTFSCPENCKCDKEGKTIECREEKCPKGQSLCPDGTCSEKCKMVITPEECKYGCSVEDKCFPMGIRTNGTYCGIDLVMSSQKSSEETCDNSFECGSNICVNGKCISASFLNQIMSWFRKLFGAE